MKSADIVPSDEDASSAESSESDTSEEEETKGFSLRYTTSNCS